ncbi:MAG: gamma-glutamyl-gamma-aminobutyrate hydrolase family protein [bacterium]
MRPLIGITCGTNIMESWDGYSPGLERDCVLRKYSRAVAESGGAPVLIPALGCGDALDAIVERLDGLLLSGGGDIAPHRYGEENLKGLGAVDSARDDAELRVLARGLERNIPILGICRGIQTLNVGMGGTLFQDIDSQIETKLKHRENTYGSPESHRVSVERGSLLARILGCDELWVNSLHHQAVKCPGRGLNVVARANDGVIEGVESADRRFVLGVQWHPEGTFDVDPFSRRIFEAFVSASGAG